MGRMWQTCHNGMVGPRQERHLNASRNAHWSNTPESPTTYANPKPAALGGAAPDISDEARLAFHQRGERPDDGRALSVSPAYLTDAYHARLPGRTPFPVGGRSATPHASPRRSRRRTQRRRRSGETALESEQSGGLAGRKRHRLRGTEHQRRRDVSIAFGVFVAVAIAALTRRSRFRSIPHASPVRTSRRQRCSWPARRARPWRRVSSVQCPSRERNAAQLAVAAA